MLQGVFDTFTRVTSIPRGWRRNVTAFAFGALATLTLPPWFIFPLLMLSFSGLFRLVETASSHRRVFWDGWWWGWGFHMTGLYWFCIALLTEPDKFAWLIPFALFGLTGIIALYPAIACWLTAKTRTHGLTKIFVFSVVWMLVEYARAHLFTGFPWNMIGYSMAFSDDVLQGASVVGIYGLTWFAVWFGALPASLDDDRISKRASGISIFLACAVLILGADWGAWRMQTKGEKDPKAVHYVEDVKLRLVQANIAQHHKWDPQLQMQGVEAYINLTQSSGLDAITHVIWPETAVPYVLRPDTTLPRMLGSAVGKNRILLTGTLRVQGEGESMKLYNSLVAIDSEGRIAGSYDKHKLVPFGEFLPFRAWLPKVLTTPVGEKDFSSGTGPAAVELPGLPEVSPLICYEGIFPDLAVDKENRPHWLLNVTNDAWFGISSGPHQHFHMARVRAVEQGLPLVRVANTGISAITDRFGRVLASLKLGEEGILDVQLPTSQNRPTAYAIYGDKLLLSLIFACMVLIIRQRRHPKN